MAISSPELEKIAALATVLPLSMPSRYFVIGFDSP
jgi:hypothetical protein